MDYVAILHKEDKSDYGVSFPDFPGCVTAGRTLDEAKDMAAEVLVFHIEGLREDGECLPAPSNLDDIAKNPDFADGFAFIVSVKEADKAVRINITVQKSDLDAIDAAASAAGMKRSAFLVNAALDR
ncbi:MAG: type II toxin-antitoxin system HicB family antitoxin [Alphaproteobacteria bacterium]|nr:type II toxin-antitoxin system HicB family antitoxin [Alphaproteobacteria bacterium]